MYASSKLRVRHFVVVLLVAGLISSFSQSALAELEFITQQIGYPVQYFEPVDIEGDGIWELALQVGVSGDSVGVYSALKKQWIDGPHYMPVEGNNWGCGDFDEDGDVNYLHLQESNVIHNNPATGMDSVLTAVQFTPEVLQVWGTTDAGEPIFSLCSWKNLDTCYDAGCGDIERRQISHWLRFLAASGVFIDSIGGGPEKGVINFIQQEAVEPYLLTWDHQSYYRLYDMPFPSIWGCSYSITLLPHNSAGTSSIRLGSCSDYGGIPYCSQTGEVYNLILANSQSTSESIIYWQLFLGYYGIFTGATTFSMIAKSSMNQNLDCWDFDADWLIYVPPYAGMAVYQLPEDTSTVVILTVSNEIFWEIRDPSTGALIDSLPGLPPADIRTAPIMENDVLDLYYFLDSTLYILDRPGMPTCILAEDNSTSIPEAFTLHQNYPNPFNASTVIEFELAKPGPVKLEIYNILGKKVAVLLDKHLPAGAHRAEWDGTDQNGHALVSGVYFYRLAIDDSEQTRKMVLLK